MYKLKCYIKIEKFWNNISLGVVFALFLISSHSRTSILLVCSMLSATSFRLCSTFFIHFFLLLLRLKNFSCYTSKLTDIFFFFLVVLVIEPRFFHMLPLSHTPVHLFVLHFWDKVSHIAKAGFKHVILLPLPL
jgi:hypothetical protein